MHSIKATTIIDIQDDPEPETFPSTFITEHPPSPPPPQSPNPTTTSPPQTTTPEPMQLDQPEIVERGLPGITQESPKPRSEVSGPDPKAPEQSMKLNGLNPDTQEQQPELSAQGKDTHTMEELHSQRKQQIPSPTKGEDVQDATMQEVEATREPELPEPQREPTSTPGPSATSAREQMERVLQDPQQCTELMQLCIARTEVLTLFPSELRLRIAPGPPTEEEVETRSEHSMASGLPLQTRAPRDTTPSSSDLVQWPTTHLFGLIRASTDQLEKRLQEAKRSTEVARKEEFVTQTCRMQEAHDKLQVQHKLEKVQERLVEAWPEIQKVAPELPEVSDAGARTPDRVATRSMDTTHHSS
jgi:hypothetical protein